MGILNFALCMHVGEYYMPVFLLCAFYSVLVVSGLTAPLTRANLSPPEPHARVSQAVRFHL